VPSRGDGSASLLFDWSPIAGVGKAFGRREESVMTERRGLKRHVRERMARTGEAYTSAHRQVTAHRPDAPVHRESDLVRRLLAVAGRELSEPMVCGLGGGIGFLYAVFEYATVPYPLLTIVAQHHPEPWAPAVLGRLGVPYAEQHSTATQAALTKLDRVTATGRPALCTVHKERLPWYADEPAMGADPYPVLVTAGDGGQLTVYDGQSRQLGTEEFGEAWAAYRKGRHHMLTVDPVATGPAGATTGRSGAGLSAAAAGGGSLAPAIRDALATTVAHLTGPVLGNSFDVNFGFSGMARLAADLRANRGRAAWVRRFGTPAGFVPALRRLDECLERAYTAPGATRASYADFLDEAAPVLDEPRLAEAAVLFRQSGAAWSGLARQAAAVVRAGAGPDDAATLFARFADVVDGCLETERRAVRLLTR
jgi:hypothetical protein